MIMKNKIKDYFDNYEVPYQPEHWVLMQQRLEIEELAEYTRHEDENFDSFVRSELEHNQVPYNPAHWQQMEAQIEANSWRGKILRYKVLEAAVLLLLIWTSVSVLDFSANNETKSAEVAAIKSHQPQLPANKPSSAIANTPLASASPQVSANDSGPNYEKSEITRPLPVLSFYIRPSVAALQIDKPHILPLEVKETSILMTDNTTTGISPSIVLNHYLPTGITSSVNTGKPFRIGVFGTTAIDQAAANTEPDPEKGNQHGLVLGGGLSFSWRLKQFEIETGAAYNSISYNNALNNTDSKLSQNLDLKNLSSEALESEKYLRLPISVKYLFDNNGSWKFYAVGGGNIHLHLNSNAAALTETPAFTDSNAKFATSLLSKNTISNEDSFLNRLNYTATIGFGIEKHLSERTSLYIQPEYYHQLFKPAITHDKGIANTLAVSVGVKAML